MKKLLRSPVFWILVVVLVAVAALGIGAASLMAKPKIADHSYLVVDLHGDLLEYRPPTDLTGELLGGSPETLHRILGNLAKVAADDRVDGVILKVSANNGAGGASLEEIRNAIARVREAGKRVVAWAESFDRRTYYLMAACDRVTAVPTAYISFTGMSMGSTHVKGTMDKLGINPNVHKIKDYKSAAEMFTREDMSATARENREWLLDELWDMYVQAMQADRGLAEAEVEAIMAEAVLSAEEALELGLVDELLYWDELEKELKPEDAEELATVSQARYAQECPKELGLEGGSKRIAVVHAQGMIGGRSSQVNPLLGVMMGHETVNADLRRARTDDDVAAVVFRVDSPGGDALTSDLIGHEIEVLAGVKPVVVSMVNVAASGGYHVSYRASRIVADALTITGSIGSINAKFNMAGMYDTLGFSFDQVTRGPMAMFFSDTRDFTDEEWQRFTENHWDGFNAWLRDVAEHRGMAFEEAEQLAHGRVWSGRQGVANGLVDEIGDLDRAIEIARELAEIPAEDKVTLDHYPRKKSLVASLLDKDEGARAAAAYVAWRLLREDVQQTLTLMGQPMAVMEPAVIR
jgi:protease-4